ncbi:MAG: asparagine synthase (glutamine-hydrolyzing) [Christensenellaceae bacterium]|jgi:asparagine synthase (glutamine-hydrolysing)|nr:asparagine synthase (glutamine-hydrolyzing) [Christensenellaceae bacterium]
MCGIAGFFGRNKNIAIEMQETLKRRGPDQNGIFEGDWTLLHTRLAVVDIEKGRQPMRFQNYILIYNGELYNTREIKRELLALGHRFFGTGDTEVLIHAYAEWKENALQKLNGIFAFAVLDINTNQLFLARDRIGVKPLFFYCNPLKGQFVFGSEIPTLLANSNVPRMLDKRGVRQFILMGPGRDSGKTPLKNINELKPAQFMKVKVEDGKIKVKRKTYWKLKEREYTKSYEESVLEVRNLAEDAIMRQLVSDVPIGTFLSGGIDSSIITAIARRERLSSSPKDNLETFSVFYQDNDKYFQKTKFQSAPDDYYIEQMKTKNNKTVITTNQLFQSLKLAVDARGLPGMADIDASLLIFCKDIKKKVTVALSGECADEIFGGYRWFYESAMHGGFPWADNQEYRLSFLKNKYKKALVSGVKKNVKLNHRQMMKLNMDYFMQTLLDRKDRMSMYNGLEVRVPFADYRLVELCYNLPFEYKYRGGIEKSVLRDAFADILPKEIKGRKKSPYPKTFNPDYLKMLEDEMQDVIDNRDEPIHKIIDLVSLKQFRDEFWYGQLMARPQTIAYFLQINYWLKKYDIKIL